MPRPPRRLGVEAGEAMRSGRPLSGARARAPLTAMALLLALGLVAGCGRTKTAEDYVHEAEAHRAAGDLPAALIDLKNALQKDPKSVAARVMLGRAYLDVPDPTSAEAELLRARQDGAARGETAQPLAEAELFLGKPEAALGETERPDEIPAGSKGALMAARAEALMALGRMGEAKQTLDAALAETPASVDVLAAMVRYALAVHDLPAARQRLERAKEVDPNNVTVMSLEGIVTFASGDFAASERAFHRMYEAARWNLSAYLGMARAETAQGKLEDADRNLAVVLKAAPADPNANYLKALVAYRRQNYAEAQASAERTLSAAKGFAPALLVAGASSLGLKQYEQANTYLGQYVYLVPDNLQARKLLASVQLQLGYAQDAVKTLAPAAQGSDDAQLLGLIGAAAARGGDLASADRYLQLALARTPEDAGLRAQFGITELALGRTGMAIDELERAAKADPSALRPEIVLFGAYLHDGQFDKALDVAERIKAAHASAPTGYDFAGLAHLAKGEDEKAAAELQRARQIHPGEPLALRVLAGMAFRDGKLDTARQYLKEILDADPKDMPAQIGLAELEIQDSHPERAEAILRQAIQAAPDDPPPRLMLGRLLLVSGRQRDALSAVEPVLAHAPQYPALLEVAGLARLAMKDTQDAVGAFKALVAIEPQSSAAHRRLAQADLAAGALDPAVEEGRKAVELDPRDAAAKSELARVYLAKRDFAGARQLGDGVAAERPDDPAAAELQGEIAAAEGRKEDAVAAFRRGAALADNGATRARLARALVLVGRTDSAEETLLPWIAGHPDDAAARLALGDIYLMAHRLDDAAVQYGAVAERQPDNVTAQNNLAWLLSEKGEREEALAHARHAAELAPNQPEVLDTLGVILMQSQRTADALAALQGAAAAAPDNREIQFHFAQALVGTGNKEEARGVLRKLLATSDAFSEREQAQRLLHDLGS